MRTYEVSFVCVCGRAAVDDASLVAVLEVVLCEGQHVLVDPLITG